MIIWRYCIYVIIYINSTLKKHTHTYCYVSVLARRRTPQLLIYLLFILVNKNSLCSLYADVVLLISYLPDLINSHTKFPE